MFILKDTAHPTGVIKNCCCTQYYGRANVGQQRCIFGYPISYVCYDIGDYILIYDNRKNMNLLFSGGFGGLGFGQCTTVFHVKLCRDPTDDAVDLGSVCKSAGDPAPLPICPPPGCAGCPGGAATPPPRLRGTFYECDYLPH
jgi:hypothetical protein